MGDTLINLHNLYIGNVKKKIFKHKFSKGFGSVMTVMLKI